MVNKLHQQIFKKGSRIFFLTGQHFPKEYKKEVASFYSLVRTADNLIDQTSPQKNQFYLFKDELFNSLNGQSSKNSIIKSFTKLSAEKQFPASWIISFFDSLQKDLTVKNYQSLKDLESYIHGSAEVIGLFMARILNLSKNSYPFAQALGKAFQYINFIRDINVDQKLGRTYLPQDHLTKFNLTSLAYQSAIKKPHQFKKFISFEISIYKKWQEKASIGFKFIPANLLLPIKSAANLYLWTAAEILKDPFVIYKKRVSPTPDIIKKIIKSNDKKP